MWGTSNSSDRLEFLCSRIRDDAARGALAQLRSPDDRYWKAFPEGMRALLLWTTMQCPQAHCGAKASLTT